MLQSEKRTYRIILLEKLLGSVPPDPAIWSAFVGAESMGKRDELSMLPEPPAGKTQGFTGFFRDPDGVYLLDYQFKGFLKEAGNVLKKALGVSALRSKVENYLFVAPRHIWLKEAPDGVLERPLLAQTARGPRVTLAASEYVAPPCEFEVELELLPGSDLTWEVVEGLLAYGQKKGLGRWRNAGFGTFRFERS